MVRRIATPLLLFFFLIIVPPFFYFFNYSETMPSTTDNKVTYEMPYPGLLPDHPLYVFKTFRDKILEIMTRDNTKKAQFHLLLSDKQIETAQLLAKKGEDSLVTTSLEQGEQTFSKTLDDLKRAKEQGASASAEFLDTIKRSNQKHEEIIQQLLKDSPSGDQQHSLQNVLQLNQKNAQNAETMLK